MYLIAILLPPVAVLLCGKPIQAVLNLILTCLFWIPGAVHACMVVSQHNAEKSTKRIEQAIKDSAKR